MRYVLSETTMRKVKALLRGGVANGEIEMRSPTPIDERAFPAPYHIQWSVDQDGWLIWLPPEALQYGSQRMSAAGNLAAVPDWPSGWYKLGFGDEGAAVPVYMTLLIADGSVASIVWDDEPATAPTGQIALAVRVATLTTKENTEEKQVKQTVNSAVHLGEAGGAGGSGYTGYLYVVGGVMYDKYSHQLKQWYTKLRYQDGLLAEVEGDYTPTVAVGAWTMIENGQAHPHRDEHVASLS